MFFEIHCSLGLHFMPPSPILLGYSTNHHWGTAVCQALFPHWEQIAVNNRGNRPLFSFIQSPPFLFYHFVFYETLQHIFNLFINVPY